MNDVVKPGIPLKPTVDNVAGLFRVGGLHETNLPRDVSLRIRKNGDGFLIFAGGGSSGLFPPSQAWEGESSSSFTANDLFAEADTCRRVWQDIIVNALEVKSDSATGRRQNSFPFQERVDFKDRPAEWLRQKGSELALAGKRLFSVLFGSSHPPAWHELGEQLKRASRERELTLLITSDCFFAPWGMLYVHPDTDTPLAVDGSNFKWEGFWGYKHIIEHNPAQVNLNNELRPDGASGKLRFSANVDDTLDKALGVECVLPLLDFFQKHPALHSPISVRKSKLELGTALSGGSFTDRILFFCCHGRGSIEGGNQQVPALKLADQEFIRPGDLKDWAEDHDGILPSHPFVFINACQGGQMATLFYKDLAAEFLRQQAVGLMGSQIDIPAVFAREYAERFFTRLLDTQNGRTRVGPLMRDLAREFVDKQNNPLALAYSLYRGADCYVP